MIRAEVSGLAYDSMSKMPVVFLKEIDGERILPIWIGFHEASAIAMVREHISPRRPLTHDLIKNIVDGLDASVIKIIVNEIQDGTYYARIYLGRGNSIVEIDARPSDSIAIALRSSAPIYIAEEVLEKGGAFTLKESKDLKHHFQELKPEDFGKFNL
ncbi:MAG: bifunctional nuclease family protein [bacterium]|nr:bifunctional nuclease family protein [bacterium]